MGIIRYSGSTEWIFKVIEGTLEETSSSKHLAIPIAPCHQADQHLERFLLQWS